MLKYVNFIVSARNYDILTPSVTQSVDIGIRGSPLDIWGGGLEFSPGHIYLFHKGDGKLYFFHLRITSIFSKPCSHFLFHSFLLQKNYFQKTPFPPPPPHHHHPCSFLMVAPLNSACRPILCVCRQHISIVYVDWIAYTKNYNILVPYNNSVTMTALKHGCVCVYQKQPRPRVITDVNWCYFIFTMLK